MYIYRHNYISLKKELERQNHGGGMSQGMRNCGTFRDFLGDRESHGQKDAKGCHVFLMSTYV